MDTSYMDTSYMNTSYMGIPCCANKKVHTYLLSIIPFLGYVRNYVWTFFPYFLFVLRIAAALLRRLHLRHLYNVVNFKP